MSHINTINHLKALLVNYPEDRLEDFIEKMFKFYTRSASYQIGRGIVFELKFFDYIKKFNPQLIKSLALSFLKGTIEKRKKHESKGFVLTWKDRQSKLGGVMNETTAIVCTPLKSKLLCRLLPGEERTPQMREKMRNKKLGKKRSEEFCAKISKAFAGVPKTEEHKANMSKSLKGRPKSEEHKAKIRASMLARKAAKNGA